MLLASCGPTAVPRVVDACQFNHSVFLTRSALLGRVLQVRASDESSSSESSANSASGLVNYAALDRGCYMPSDLLHELLELGRFSSRLAVFCCRM